MLMNSMNVCINKVCKNNSKGAFKYVSFTSYNPVLFFVNKKSSITNFHMAEQILTVNIFKNAKLSRITNRRAFLFHQTD